MIRAVRRGGFSSRNNQAGLVISIWGPVGGPGLHPRHQKGSGAAIAISPKARRLVEARRGTPHTSWRRLIRAYLRCWFFPTAQTSCGTATVTWISAQSSTQRRQLRWLSTNPVIGSDSRAKWPRAAFNHSDGSASGGAAEQVSAVRSVRTHRTAGTDR